LNILVELIEAFDPEHPNFRPTEIYNEGWLLKGFLHHAAQTDLGDSPLAFAKGSTWFSEALLPTAFKARYRGDPLAESRTHADGVIGHILIGEQAKADLALDPGATQFVVIEAKIGAPLSPGIRHAPDFDQAARTVACMAEVLHQAGMPPGAMDALAFIVLAPGTAIEAGTFSREMDRAGIRGKIQARVEAYEGRLDAWYRAWAEPTLAAISLHSVSWEQAIRALAPEAGRSLKTFYASCLAFNE
jgi:hypothetical protein